ncbi:14056_t:CDS:2, partial [Entrophospora sp. SA101]
MTTESNTEEQSGAVERKINPKRSRSKKTKAEKNEQSSNLPTSKSFLSSAKDLRLDEILYTIDAKPQKLSSGYGWTASLPNSRIKVEINGEEVELP